MQVTLQLPTDAIMSAIIDKYSRKIFLSAIQEAKSVQTISKENGIPLSSCYRKVNEMVQVGSLVVERIILWPSGRKYGLYRSCYRGVTVTVNNGKVSITAEINEAVAAKLHDAWLSSRFGPEHEKERELLT